MTTLGLKNVNMLSKEQYDGVAEPVKDELYAISGSGFGMPSDRYEDLELGASGTTYTAPANGWVSFMKIGGASGKQVVLINSTGTKSMRTNSACSSSGQWLCVYLPVQKGDTFVAEYDATGETKRFRFIYSEGE
jgi:hypothetical protein